MQSKVEYTEPTRAKLTIEADRSDLAQAKQLALAELSTSVKVAGFRPGRVPLQVAEKHLDPNQLAQEALEQAVNGLYAQALIENRIRPVDNPEIRVKAYVPFDALNFEAELEVIGRIKLGKYRGLSLKKEPVSISARDINTVLKRLQRQAADRVEVKRATAAGDEVVIDFVGYDAQTKEPISGASGKDYALEIGSNSFIPGFEDQIVGLKAGDTKKFKIKFPSDYGVAFLKDKPAEFDVTLKKVKQLKLAPLNDKFAAQAGPFKSLTELKADIRKQLKISKDDEAGANYQNALVNQIVASSDVAIPASLITDEVGRFERDQRQNAAYRGQTWQEYLASEGISQKQFLELANDQARQRVKAGLVLGEIAGIEKLSVGQEELEDRLNRLKEQYAADNVMQQELSKEQNIQDIRSRLLVEKTISRLEELNQSAAVKQPKKIIRSLSRRE